MKKKPFLIMGILSTASEEFAVAHLLFYRSLALCCKKAERSDSCHPLEGIIKSSLGIKT